MAKASRRTTRRGLIFKRTAKVLNPKWRLFIIKDRAKNNSSVQDTRNVVIVETGKQQHQGLESTNSKNV